MSDIKPTPAPAADRAGTFDVSEKTPIPADIQNDDDNTARPSSDGSATEQVDEAAVEEEPPKEFKEGGYGWVVVLAVFLLNAHTWGLNSSYAVFLAYYLNNNVFPDATPIAYAFIGGLSISIALLVSPICTMLIGRYGTRPTLFFGIILETIAFIGASFTSRIWHLLLSQGIAFGLGMGFIFVASVGIVPQWFVKRRSFANALATGGSGFGGLTYSLATNAMIRNIGLAWAFRVIAIVCFVVNTASMLLVRDRNKSVGSIHIPFNLKLLRRIEYNLLLAWAFFSILGYVIIVFSLPSYASAVGRTASQGSLVAALFNLSQGIGRPAIGFLSDPIGRLNVMGLGTLIAGVSALFLWIFAGKAFAGLIVYSLLGAFAGLIWATVAPVCAEIVGIPMLPSALSVLWITMVPPATCAEAIGLSLRDDSAGHDSYLHVQLFAGLCYIAAFAASWLLRAWKLHQLEDAINEEARTPRQTFGAYILTGRWIFKVQCV